MKKNISNHIRKLAASLQGPIPRRQLGKTGLSVTQLGLGGGCAVGSDKDFSLAINLIRAAIELGINYIDTANEYGPSEEHIGIAVEPARKDLVLASKTQDRTRDGSMRLLEESLTKLKTDYLDIWQIHHIDHQDEVKAIFAKDGAIRALEEAKEQGMVHNVGITGHYDPKPLLTSIKRYNFDTILLAMNAADVHKNSFIEGVLPEAVKQNLGIIGMKVTSLGRIFNSWNLNNMKDALDYVLSLPVATAIVGVDSMKQLYENVTLSKDHKPLSKKKMKELEDSTKKYAHLANFFRKGNEEYNPFWKPYGWKKKEKK